MSDWPRCFPPRFPVHTAWCRFVRWLRNVPVRWERYRRFKPSNAFDYNTRWNRLHQWFIARPVYWDFMINVFMFRRGLTRWLLSGRIFRGWKRSEPDFLKVTGGQNARAFGTTDPCVFPTTDRNPIYKKK